MKQLLKEARALAVAEIEKYGLPNLLHLEISEQKVIELSEELNADKDIALLGVYLMDVKLGQAFKENILPQHVKMSVDATKKFLAKFDIDISIKEKVINCVDAHHGDIPFKCLEAEICANADCYRFASPKGFFIYLTVLGRRNSDFYECLAMAEKKMDEKYNVLSLDTCKKELEPKYHILKEYIQEARL